MPLSQAGFKPPPENRDDFVKWFNNREPPVEAKHQPQYGRPNPQSKVCHEILAYAGHLHRARDLASKHLQQDELGFFDIDDLEDLISVADLEQLTDLAMIVKEAKPDVANHPRAPPMDVLYDSTNKSKLVNFGAGSQDNACKGTISFDPMHIYTSAGDFGAGAKSLSPHVWERAKQDLSVGVVSRNAIMHCGENELSTGFSAHIVPNYRKWVKTGLAVKLTEDEYSLQGLVAAHGTGGTSERDWSVKAQAVVDLGMFMAIYFIPSIIVYMKRVAIDTIVPCRGMLPSMATPGTYATLAVDTEFTPKIDGRLRHILFRDGLATMYDTNRQVVEAFDCGKNMLDMKLSFEQVGNVLYLVNAYVCGIRLPALMDVLEAFLNRICFVVDGYTIRNKPRLDRVCGVPCDGVIGSSFSNPGVNYYKSVSCVDIDLLHDEVLDKVDGRLAQAGREAKVDLDMRGYKEIQYPSGSIVVVRLAQQVTKTSAVIVPTPCFKLISAYVRLDKKMQDPLSKIVNLLKQPRAEAIMAERGLTNFPFPAPVLLELENEAPDEGGYSGNHPNYNPLDVLPDD